MVIFYEKEIINYEIRSYNCEKKTQNYEIQTINKQQCFSQCEYIAFITNIDLVAVPHEQLN